MNPRTLKKIVASFDTTDKMPVLFLGHGSPMNAIEENEFTKAFSDLSATIPKPRAILCISAHWETSGTYVTAMEKPPTIHDFGGFPPELFNVQYPVAGSPELAEEIKSIVRIAETGFDQKWGLDHGAWSVLKHMYPAADVPVVQMSLDYRQTIGFHYDLAMDLASLRYKGVLIAGSGNLVHNLGLIAWDKFNDKEFSYDWAAEASKKLKDLIVDGNHRQLINYLSLGNALKLAVPTPEHFLPVLYALALQEKNEQLTLFNDKIIAGSLSMTSLKIG